MATHHIPRVPGGSPLTGHLGEFRRNPVEFLLQCTAEHGPVFCFRYGAYPVYALLSPETNGVFFRSSNEQLSSHELHRYMVPILGKEVAYGITRELMDEQLRMVHQVLAEGMMERCLDHMVGETRRFLDGLGERGELEMPTAFGDLVLSILGRCMLGDDFPAHARAFAANFAALEAGMNPLSFVAPNLPTPTNVRRNRARRVIVAMIRPLAAARRQRASREHPDFLSALVAARYRDGAPLSDAAVTGLLLMMMVAGLRTSAALASWLGVLLMQHPSHVASLRAEADTVLADAGLQFATVRRLKRLDYCIKEAERLHPPVIVIMRRVLKDFPVAGAMIPRRSLAMVAPAVTHRLPHVFDNPDAFDPDRFAPPRSEDLATPYSLIGFGGGKHRCLGHGFAYQQLKVIWTMLLDRFDCELVSPAQPDYMKFGPVAPLSPCRARYRTRETSVQALRDRRFREAGGVAVRA